MKKNLQLIFQIAAVFIGTVVGAGLASGQEITQFFTTYGVKSFIGIIFCCFIYIITGSITVKISASYKLNSYSDFINLVSPGILGKVIDILMSLFLISSAAIILAGSGALIHQYFGISKWVGIIIMTSISLFTLFRDTKGLVEINSFIVPSLITVIITIFVLYLIFNKGTLNLSYLKTIQFPKEYTSTKFIHHSDNYWFLSSILYAGFNILCCSGVLVPMSTEIDNNRNMSIGISIGAIGLTILSLIINLLLLLNVPYICQYEIPLLYIANRFGALLQIMLLCIIWLEMFSTEVSDIYSIGKTMEQVFKISYKKSVILILALAIPISQIGFVNLIKILYPAFGVVSIIFMIKCFSFYFRCIQKNN